MSEAKRTATKARGRSRDGGDVRIKRAYEEPAASDGRRVLVDRLWPRGTRKEALALEAWMKDVGPSDELRRWFGHDPSRFEAFAARYREELREPPMSERLDELVELAKKGRLTLVYGAKDELHNQAVVLRDRIQERLRRARPSVASRASVGARKAPVRKGTARRSPAGS
jgi:uncharacterized protein YeaO (DUF488 family)